MRTGAVTGLTPVLDSRLSLLTVTGCNAAGRRPVIQPSQYTQNSEAASDPAEELITARQQKQNFQRTSHDGEDGRNLQTVFIEGRFTSPHGVELWIDCLLMQIFNQFSMERHMMTTYPSTIMIIIGIRRPF